MRESFVRFAFTAGVSSPRLFARTDIERYDLGLAQGRNWVINYLGGASVRPGTEFLDYIQDDDEPARLVEFKFNTNIANTYAVLFAKDRIRFLQDGAYVLETAVAISGTTSTTVTTSASHGYSTDDMVKIDGRTLIVASTPTGTTFTVNDAFGNAADPSTTSPSQVQRVYTIASPYATADLVDLRVDQELNTLYITHPDYTYRKLVRTDATNWTLSTISASTSGAAPTSVTLNASGSGSAGIVYAVTVIDVFGVEHPLAATGMALIENSVNFSATAGSMEVTWPTVSNAAAYKVYRSIIHPTGTEVSFGVDLGYVGRTKTPRFVDNNIIPDFTNAPLSIYNPFDDGRILHIEVTAGGSGYTKSTATVSATVGSGFSGVPIVDDTGAIVSVLILNPGSGYTGTAISFGGGGSGATATATVSEASGNNPTASRKVQQRRVYAGTTNAQDTFVGSRIGEPENFDQSELGLISDSYTLTLDKTDATPIHNVQEGLDGMFLFTESGIWQVRGTDDGLISADTAKASPQTREGASSLHPITISREFLFQTSAKEAIKVLGPSNLPTYFVVRDVSQFSNHYFKGDNPVVSWTWAQEPDRVLWAAREDGTFLSFTYLPEEQVRAWSDHTTQGYVEDVEAVFENNQNRAYTIVRRKIGTTDKRFIERFAPLEPDSTEQMWAVDCGLTTALTKPAAKVDVTGYSGAQTVTALSSIFASGDVGKVFRAGGGRATVTAFSSSTEIDVTFDVPIPQAIPELTTPPQYLSGEWSLTEPSTTFSGLDHLEGMTVQVLADGAVETDKTVSGGSITLSRAASLVTVGLGYTGTMQTLPLVAGNQNIEAHRRRITDVVMRLFKARGLEAGDGVNNYPLPARRNEPYGAAPDWLPDIVELNIAQDFDQEGRLTIVKSGPVSATVLGLALQTDIEQQP